jgi:hypothetical protein
MTAAILRALGPARLYVWLAQYPVTPLTITSLSPVYLQSVGRSCRGFTGLRRCSSGSRCRRRALSVPGGRKDSEPDCRSVRPADCPSVCVSVCVGVIKRSGDPSARRRRCLTDQPTIVRARWSSVRQRSVRSLRLTDASGGGWGRARTRDPVWCIGTRRTDGRSEDPGP